MWIKQTNTHSEIWAIIASYLYRFLLHAEPCIPLGMESGKILDSAITSSSVLNHNFKPYYARLRVHRGSCAWGPSYADTQDSWLRVDFGNIFSLTGIATQGRCNWRHRVTSYTVSYSTDTDNWQSYMESGNIKVSLYLYWYKILQGW